MSVTFKFLLSLSILIPVLTGFYRFKRLKHFYYPMFILLVIGLLNEFLSYYLIHALGSRNGVSSKIYSLIECSLILYQLYVWRNSKKSYRICIIIFGICLITWVVESIFILKPDEHGPYFRTVYAFFIVLLSINQVNAIMVQSEASVLKNPIIIFCVSFIIFFTFQMILESARYLLNHVDTIATYNGARFINVGTNILYAIALFLVKSENNPVYEKHVLNR